MKLTKEMNQLLRENYYTLVEDIRGDINKWREIPGSWMIKRNIAKSEKSPQTDVIFQCDSSQNLNRVFQGTS